MVVAIPNIVCQCIEIASTFAFEAADRDAIFAGQSTVRPYPLPGFLE